MAKGNLPACLPVTLSHEGEWADHLKDPGGATMKGVTLAVFRKYKPGATKVDLRKIAPEMVEHIYRDGYWTPIRGEDLPYGVDLATFDYGVNSGPSRAVKHLQAVAGVKQDGKVGAETLKALIIVGGKPAIQKLCAKRLSFVHGLSTFKVFGKGWSRRIADVEARAVAMWLTNRAVPWKVDVPAILKDEAAKAETKAKEQNKAGGASAGGGAVVGGADLATNSLGWVALVVVVVAVAVAVGALVKARQNKDRAAAYARVAGEVA